MVDPELVNPRHVSSVKPSQPNSTQLDSTLFLLLLLKFSRGCFPPRLPPSRTLRGIRPNSPLLQQPLELRVARSDQPLSRVVGG